MAEIGIVMVGPTACALAERLGSSVPKVLVRPDAIVPMPEDLPQMVSFAASKTFEGPEADRWRLVPDAKLEEQTEVLWACSQAHSADLHEATNAWDKVLVIGWLDEPALIPVVRAVVQRERPVTVLLGGNDGEVDPALAQSVKVVLADLVRRDQLTTVICNPSPADILDVALDAARSPDALRVPRARPVDLGPMLDLPSTWCMPAPPVHFFRLVHVPMGHARRLSEAAIYVAAYKVLRDAISGPPVDVEGTRVLSPQEVRARLPHAGTAAAVAERAMEALGRVRFEGNRPLVDAIERALRPVHAEIDGIRSAIADVERLRLQHLRAFTAVGIEYTVQALSTRLDNIQDPYPLDRAEQLEGLVSGEGAVGASGQVHLTAWRHTFSGLSCQVAPRGAPGRSVAREMVQDRFSLFRGEYGAGLSRSLDVLLRRAHDSEASPIADDLRALRDRAVRVREALIELQQRLWDRVLRECEMAVRDDRLVRWAAPTAEDLATLLMARIAALPVSGDLERATNEALTRRPLGMADDGDFERYLQELTREAHGLVAAVPQVPTYEEVLLLLLEGRDPPVLRQALAAAQGTEVELHLERAVEPALMNWLTATGMLVVVAPRLKTCAIYWQRLEQMSSRDGQRRRRATTEHRLADLLLALPEGDTADSLVALAKAAAYVLVALALGVLRPRKHADLAVLEVSAASVPGLGRQLLPCGLVHAVSADHHVLEELVRAVHASLAALATRHDAAETLRKLLELAKLGPSPGLAAQVGVLGSRFEHLEHPIHALLQRLAQMGEASLVDAMHTSELSQVTKTPRRRAVADVMQLAPARAS